MEVGPWVKRLPWACGSHLDLGCRSDKTVPKPCGQLTGAELAGEPVCQLAPLGQVLPEALPQVVVNVIAPQKVLKGLHCVFCMLGEKVTDAPAFSYFLA